MVRLILLLLIVAGVAGYFTKPDEATMRAGADAVLSDPGSISEGLESVGATIAGDRAYNDYYVAAKYDVTLDGTPVVSCWGAFQQVQCSRVEDTRTGG
ncbi:MAG: hypothetical protein DCF16_12200 [Alphaproteobacteria bacterium]|jgi:hypothetical protein|nr:MAG: hypothetical protein DCF16_12200 [Alphaproteobacteria bacterium]